MSVIWLLVLHIIPLHAWEIEVFSFTLWTDTSSFVMNGRTSDRKKNGIPQWLRKKNEALTQICLKRDPALSQNNCKVIFLFIVKVIFCNDTQCLKWQRMTEITTYKKLLPTNGTLERKKYLCITFDYVMFVKECPPLICSVWYKLHRFTRITLRIKTIRKSLKKAEGRLLLGPQPSSSMNNKL